MRIITGKLGGRTFSSPRGYKTRPMSNKAVGALFNVLGDVEGLTILDAYGGSGALAFEAISRGSKSATAIESDKEAHKTIVQNISDLGLDAQVMALRANIKTWSNNNRDAVFDVVLLDPPYDDLQRDVLQKISRHAKAGGIVVLSWPGKEPAPPFEGLEQVTSKKHGDIQLVFYRKIKKQ